MLSFFVSRAWPLTFSFPLSVRFCSQSSNASHCQSRQPIRHEPNHVRAKLPALVLQAKRDSVVAWCAMAPIVAMSAEHRHKLRERLKDDSPCASDLLFRGFSVLVTHNRVTWERRLTRKDHRPRAKGAQIETAMRSRVRCIRWFGDQSVHHSKLTAMLRLNWQWRPALSLPTSDLLVAA